MDSLPRFVTPRNDNETLLNYQYEVRRGNRAAFDGMYRLGKSVALRMINQQAEGNRHVRALCRELREEKAHNAITYIIARYCSVPGFAIKKSFPAYIFLRVRHELYYRTKAENIVQYVDAEKLGVYRTYAGRDAELPADASGVTARSFRAGRDTAGARLDR